MFANLGLALTAGATLTALACIAVAGAGHLVSYRGRHQRRTILGQTLLGALLAAVLITGRPVEAEDAVHAAVNAGESTTAGELAEGELVGETA